MLPSNAANLNGYCISSALHGGSLKRGAYSRHPEIFAEHSSRLAPFYTPVSDLGRSGVAMHLR